MIITKEQYLSALKQKGVLNENRVAVLKIMYETGSYKAHSREIGKKIGRKMVTINLRFGSLARKIAEHLNITPTKRSDGSYQWYKIIADGKYEANGFNWQLKNNFIEAILELGVLSESKVFPEEISFADREFMEGGVRKVLVNAYERSTEAREECIRIHGVICKVCNMNFENIYGEIGKEFIHVHHVVKRSVRGSSKYRINPVTDLVPVCPNCHAMLHRRTIPFTIDELKQRIKHRFE